MLTEYLREFTVLASCLSFNKASAQLHISQSTLSKHIAALEHELGFPLFTRKGATRLTTAGERFCLRAQTVLNALNEGIEECRGLAYAGQPVRLQWNRAYSCIIEPMLVAVKTPFVLIEPDSKRSIVESILTQHADVAIVYNIDSNQQASTLEQTQHIGFEPIGREKLGFITSKQTPMAQSGQLTSSDLSTLQVTRAYEYVFEDSDSETTSTFEYFLAHKSIQDSRLLSDDYILFCDLYNKLLIGLSTNVERICSRQPNFAAFDTLDGNPVYVDEYLAYSKDNPNPNVRFFIDEMRAIRNAAEPDAPDA